MSLDIKQKLSLIVLLLVSAFLSVYGGFRVNHIDTEYHKTLYNKSYFLYNIYHLTSKLELESKKLFFDSKHPIQKYSLSKFKKTNQRHGFSLYFVNTFFALLGVFACFKIAYLFSNNFGISYLAAWILTSCYFWNAEAHYPTTDLALSSLCLAALLYFTHHLITKEDSSLSQQINEGLILGACFSIKYAGIIILIPFLFYKFKTSKLKESILSIFIAMVFLAVSISDKFKELIHHLSLEYKVQTEIGWAGYNSNESGFLYHLKNSLVTEYGLTLTLLALIGVIYLYRRYQETEKRLALKIIFIFVIALSVMISSTIIKTVRFALPLIPIFSIFSAFGIYQIYLLIKTFNPKVAKLAYVLLIVAATAPALKNSIKHDYLMAGPDTHDFVSKLRRKLKQPGAIMVLLNDKLLFDKTPNLDDIQYIKRCSSAPKDFQRIFKFNEYPKIIVSTNSYKLDRFIFDEAYQCDNGHKAFTGYQDLKLLQVTPFKVNKEDVPFSFISNFSPRKPDLKYRNYKGGFFELFYVSEEFDKILKQECEMNNFPCHFTNGANSYFLSTIQTSFIDPKVREKQNKSGLSTK